MDLEVNDAVIVLNSLDHLVAINDVALDLDKSSKRRRLNIRRPELHGVSFKALTPTKSETLELPFSVNDIKELIRSYAGDKSSSPDDYNMASYKVAWNIIKLDLWEYVNEFFRTAHLPRRFLVHSFP
ncbi:hypothetical protein KIW84_052726 [Lathyrus oleraceus]|uniref:Uncharacterized protein n=1 Tax=Pisum sativum TaxID=3888 RepID=A0A9D4WR42_PEA|nr:hypothetical protein KIW84_052726 [Pisum sativum]